MIDRKGPQLTLPSALNNDKVDALIRSSQTAIFLDYDGTITDLVDDPSEAFLSAETRRVLLRLSSLCPCAIISGRDVIDLKNRVKLGNIAYAGCHGLDIITADGRRQDDAKLFSFLPRIDWAEATLRSTMKTIPGVIIEHKRFGVSVHYRKVDPSLVKEVEQRFNAIAFPKLKQSKGKKLLEVLPNVRTNKGVAILSIMRSLRIPKNVRALPIFIGDDLTDEYGFKVVRKSGLGIIVSEENRIHTFARLFLRNPVEVRLFLERVFNLLKATDRAESSSR